MISYTVPARVGILGNPSDGYGGRTLGLAVPHFGATVELEESDELEIIPNPDDEPIWDTVDDLIERTESYGYLTGAQLLAATVRTFADVASFEVSSGVEGSPMLAGFSSARFALRYKTSIPRQVGLGGSSALVIAALRCLNEFTELEVPDEILPSIALRVETEQLGLTAGLQDRVVQTYGGLVAMHFGEMVTDARFGVAHGEYHLVDQDNLPPLFLAYREAAAESSSQYHRVLRQRYESGDSTVRDVLHNLAGLALEGEAALRWNDPERFAELIGENMRLRRKLGAVRENQIELIDLADGCDAPATFAGSGGAIVGAYTDAEHLSRIAGVLGQVDAVVVSITVGAQSEA